jgi:Asp-tRNA(Asn)/Glu-tRNA(Gln) amidotransferase A subunit family amidase
MAAICKLTTSCTERRKSLGRDSDIRRIVRRSGGCGRHRQLGHRRIAADASEFLRIFAHKPTYGLVSQEGFSRGRERKIADMDLAVIGPLARSFRDLRLLLSMMTTGVAAPLRHGKLQGIKATLWLNEPDFALDPETRAPLGVFAERLAAAGAIVEPVACPVSVRQMMFAYTTLLYACRARICLGQFAHSTKRCDRRRNWRWRSAANRSLGRKASSD